MDIIFFKTLQLSFSLDIKGIMYISRYFISFLPSRDLYPKLPLHDNLSPHSAKYSKPSFKWTLCWNLHETTKSSSKEDPLGFGRFKSSACSTKAFLTTLGKSARGIHALKHFFFLNTDFNMSVLWYPSCTEGNKSSQFYQSVVSVRR